MAGPRAYRAQDGHLPASLVETAEDGSEHANQPGQYDEHRDYKQGLFRHTEQAPELLQRNARNNCHQRLIGEAVDIPLHREAGHPAVQAQQRSVDGGWREILLFGARRMMVVVVVMVLGVAMLGVLPGLRTRRHAVVPVGMDCFLARQADMHDAVHRRTGAGQDTADPERLVGMVDEAYRTGTVP